MTSARPMLLRTVAPLTLALATLALATVAAVPHSGGPALWGEDGHTMAARAATELLPADMPAFFTAAAEQLVWLNPEPDRWRSRDLPTLDGGFAYDHYIDLENMPEGAWDATDRWAFVRTLHDANLQRTGELGRPERDVGLLPYRIEELQQRLLTGFRLWRDATGPERAWLEARILNDAGVLGHYVTDAAQPHHTTIHFNGWNASSTFEAPNPEGYTTERDFHGRFESAFVSAHVSYDEVLATATTRPLRALGGPAAVREAIRAHILESHAQVEPLYALEKQARFEAEGIAPATHVAFAAERLGAGAAMLRDLWVTAWRESENRPAPR